MKRFFKWIGILVAALIILTGISVVYLKNKFENIDSRTFSPEVKAIHIPSDSISITRGKILSVSCRSCHGVDLAGSDFFNDPNIGYMSSPNLSRSHGSATEKYVDLDYVRAVRHGLDPKGRALMVMPSESIGLLSDEDLGCLIAYLKSITPIKKSQGPTQFTYLAKVMAGAGLFGNLYPYDVIKHDSVHHITAPPKSTKPAYGAYFASYEGCKSCHGEKLNGGISPDPISPPAPNITSGGKLGSWTLDQFKETLRGGKTPNDKILDAKFMPWPGIGAHDDIDLEALFNYLKSLPELPDSPELINKMKKLKKS